MKELLDLTVLLLLLPPATKKISHYHPSKQVKSTYESNPLASYTPTTVADFPFGPVVATSTL